MLIVASLIAVLFPQYISGEENYFLFNTQSDPTESTNLYYDDSYTDILENLKKRADYWAEQVKQPDIPDWTYAGKTFDELGGTGAWLTVDYTPRDIPALYSYKDAPNIVFVLVDDWGWNDVGWRSTYLSWTTPTIDKLASEGVKLNAHYTHELCVPTRGALMTGRYSLRLGLWNQTNQQSSVLPLNETTIGQELQSAGYRTYMVGKWDLGYAATQYFPINRGFHSYYGYFTGQMDYWTKRTKSSTPGIDGTGDVGIDDDSGFLDLHVNSDLVTVEDELSDTMHTGFLFEEKAEAAIQDWNENYNDRPMFLYYALQLVHTPFEAPDRFMTRCGSVSMDDDYIDATLQGRCALNVMLDEVIANLTCTLEEYGMSDNTVLIIASDNGGQEVNAADLVGNNYPFRGAKGDYWRGGVSTTALIHSKLLPDMAWGLEYNGNIHITDWLPTIMRLATNNEWSGPLSGYPIDGVDMWNAITSNDTSKERSEIVFYVDDSDSETTAAIQHHAYRYYSGILAADYSTPDYVFSEDKDSSLSYEICSDPTLMYDDSSSSLYGAVLSFYKGSVVRAWMSTGVPAIATFLGLAATVAMVTVVSRRYVSGSASKGAAYHRLPEVDDSVR